MSHKELTMRRKTLAASKRRRNTISPVQALGLDANMGKPVSFGVVDDKLVWLSKISKKVEHIELDAL